MLHTINLYTRMARPLQLTAVFLVYSWGYLLTLTTLRAFQSPRYFGGLAVLLLVSASIHYANEYADYETDALTQRTPFSGGSGAMQTYNVPHQTALRAALIALGGALLSALFVYNAGWLPAASLALLVAGAIGGWSYSLRPLALAWRGWGEMTNALLGGMLLPIYGFSLHGTIRLDLLLVSIPFTLLVFLNLLATTWADRQVDEHVGKRTLATRWPVRWLRLLYFLIAAVTYIVVFLLRCWLLPDGAAWLSLLLLPFTVWAGLGVHAAAFALSQRVCDGSLPACAAWRAVLDVVLP